MTGTALGLVTLVLKLLAVFFVNVDRGVCAISGSMTSSPNTLTKVRGHVISGFGQAEEGQWTGPYYFIFAADPQPGLIDLFDGGTGDRWDSEVRLMDKAVVAMNKLQPKPRFLCLGGDIVNAFPGEKWRAEQLRDVQSCFSRLNEAIPILVVSGNHDVGNVPTNESRDIFNQEFGDEYYSFWVGGVFYIVIDTQYMFNDSLTPERSAAQESWLEAQLAQATTSNCQHVVIFMHIPIFLESVDEDDNYFSIKRKDRIPLLQRFADAGVRKVFHGHYHRNAGGLWTARNDDGAETKIEVVVSSALGAQLGDDKSGINIVKVTEDEVSHRYYPLDEIPERVEF